MDISYFLLTENIKYKFYCYHFAYGLNRLWHFKPLSSGFNPTFTVVGIAVPSVWGTCRWAIQAMSQICNLHT